MQKQQLINKAIRYYKELNVLYDYSSLKRSNYRELNKLNKKLYKEVRKQKQLKQEKAVHRAISISRINEAKCWKLDIVSKFTGSKSREEFDLTPKHKHDENQSARHIHKIS